MSHVLNTLLELYSLLPVLKEVEFCHFQHVMFTLGGLILKLVCIKLKYFAVILTHLLTDPCLFSFYVNSEMKDPSVIF